MCRIEHTEGQDMRITDSVVARHPATIMGLLEAQGLTSADPVEWAALKAQETDDFRHRMHDYNRKAASLTHPVSCYTSYYRRYGKSYPVQLQMESVVLKARDIKAACLAVETMFLAEVRHGLLVAGHDTATLRGDFVLDAAAGGETFTTVSGQSRTLKSDDLYLMDGSAILSSVLEGQAKASSLTPESTSVLYCVYGIEGVTRADMDAFFTDLRRYILTAFPHASVGCPAYHMAVPA